MTVRRTLDEWLDSVPENICFTEKMKIYAPTCYGGCEPEVSKLVRRLNDMFGGSTVYEKVEGCWNTEKDGKPFTECEPVKVIEIGHKCNDRDELVKLAGILSDYALAAKQQAISVKNNHFYIVKSDKLKEAYEKAGLETAEMAGV